MNLVQMAFTGWRLLLFPISNRNNKCFRNYSANKYSENIRINWNGSQAGPSGIDLFELGLFEKKKPPKIIKNSG